MSRDNQTTGLIRLRNYMQLNRRGFMGGAAATGLVAASGMPARAQGPR